MKRFKHWLILVLASLALTTLLFGQDFFSQAMNFILGTSTGTFVISNDAISITGLNTTLNSSASWATQMRFGNTTGELSAASRTGYRTGFNRTLASGVDGIRWVYAQFSGNGVVRNVFDSVIYDKSQSGTVDRGNLRIRLDSSYTGAGTTFRYNDVWPYRYATTGVAGASRPTTGTRTGGLYMSYNGAAAIDVPEAGSGMTDYPFTITARIYPTRYLSNAGKKQDILSIWDAKAGNQYRSCGLKGTTNTVFLAARNGAGSEKLVESTTGLTINKRYSIVCQFNSSGDRKVYVNNQLYASDTVQVWFLQSATNTVRIGELANNAPNDLFSGYMDDVRLRNITVMSPYQLPTYDPLVTYTGAAILYGTLPLASVKTGSVTLTISGNTYSTTGDGPGKYKTLPLSPILSPGTYNVTMTYADIYGVTGTKVYTWGLVILPAPTIIYSPASWNRTSGNILATVSGLDLSHMFINNSGSETYTFTNTGSYAFQFIDQVGTTWQITATATWIDRTAPTVSLIAPASGAVLSGNTLFSRSASDNVSISGYTFRVYNSSWAVIYTTGLTTTNTYFSTSNGSYTRNVTATDEVGNTGVSLTRGFTFNTPDGIPPSITLIAPTSGTIISGSTLFTRSGADNEATSGYTFKVYNASWIQIYSTGRLNSTGIYFDTGSGIYTRNVIVRDTSNNVTTGTARTFVVDKSAPSVTLLAPTSGTHFSGTRLFTWSWYDNISISGYTFKVYNASWTQIYASWNLLTTGINFTTGDGYYSRNVTAIDEIGNTATSATRWFATDTAKPTVTLYWSSTVYVEYGSSYTEAWAYRTDAIDGIGTIASPTSGSVNTGALGTYTLTYLYTDQAGNTGNVTRTVIVRDTTAPTIALNGSWTITVERLSPYTELWATWTDIHDGTGTVTTILGTVDTSVSSTYVLTYIHVDSSGNTGSTIRTIYVVDTMPPTATIVYSNTWRTNQDVIATITGFSEDPVYILSEGGNTHTFTDNGSFVFRFQDAYANQARLTGTVTNIDKIAPVITLNGSSTIYLQYHSWYTELGATRTDNVAGSGTVTNISWNVNTWALWTYYVTYTYVDWAGNTWTNTRTVHVVNTIAPTVTLNGSNVINVEYLGTYTELWAKRTDVVDGSGTVSNINGTVNTGTLGTYYITYTYVDSAGLTWTVTRTVNVVDTTAPTVTLNGSGTLTLERLGTYTELGAYRTDAHDGSGTIASPTSGSVNTSVPGTYVLTYQYVDASGNTGTVTRTINITDTTKPTANVIYSTTGITNQDVTATLTGRSEAITGVNAYNHIFTWNGSFIFTFEDMYGNTGSVTANVTWIDKTAPVITLNGLSTVYVPYGSWYTEEWSTWMDNVDGSGTVSIISGSVNTGTLGTYVLTYIKVDAAGNTGTATRTVIVTNTTAPTITLYGSSPIDIEFGDAYAEQGAERYDLADGTGVVTLISGTVNTGTLGTYLIEYSYMNSSGLTGTASRIVNVVDTTPPTITLYGSSPITIERLSTYTELGARRYDTYDGSGTVTTISGSVNASVAGTYILTYIYVDSSGNTGSATRTVYVEDTIPPTATIIYSLTGWTNHNVDAILTWFSEPITITNNGWFSDYTFTGNGAFTFEFKDASDNTGSATATVTRIDKIKPVVTINGSDVITMEFKTEYMEHGALRTDNVDGSGAVTDISGSVNTGVLWSYTLEYRYMDQAGNTGNDFRTVNVVDTTAPSVVLYGSSPITIERLGIYTELGAYRTDAVDGSGTVPTPSSGTVNTSIAGTYLLTYLYVDAAGNTGTVTRTVNVVDTTKPTASVIYSEYTRTNKNVIATLTGYSEPITITNNGGSADRTFTTNGSFTFNFEDDYGNTGTVTATVTRIDKIAPVVAINGSTPIEVEFGSNYTELGATWTDTIDGSWTNVTIIGSVDTGALWIYNLTYRYVDQAGNTWTDTRTVDIVDTTAPIVMLSWPSTISIRSGGTYIEYGATRTDAYDGSGFIASPTSGAVNTSVPGTYILEYTYVDASGNTGTVTRTVHILDDRIPIITLYGSSPIDIEFGGTYAESWARREDNADGSGNVTLISGSVSIGVLWTYTIEYFYINSLGLTGTITRTINVVDTTAPSVTLNGSAMIDIEFGSSYTEFGAYRTDAYEGSGTIPTPTYGSVNTGILGTYALEYTKADSSGNTGTVTRTVNIVDTTAPSITLNGPATIDIEFGNDYLESWAIRYDTHDGTGYLVPIAWSVDTGSLWTYVLTYRYVDAAGNTGTVTRTVNIVDATAPSITLNGPATIDIEFGNDYLESGATRIDAHDGNGTIPTPTYGSVNTWTLGAYLLRYTRTDSSGNTGTVTRTVNIVDTTSPVVTLVGSGSITLPRGFTYTESGATRTDAHDGNGTIPTPTYGSVNTSVIATYVLEYTKTDIAGNSGTVIRTVQIGENNIRPTMTLSGTCNDYDGCTCNSSTILYGDYCTITPTPPSWWGGGWGGGWGGWGGGTTTVPPKPETPPIEKPVITPENIHAAPPAEPGDITDSPYNQELNDAYQWAYEHGITTMSTVMKADMDRPILRKELAKMISVFATQLMTLEPENSRICSFQDIAQESMELQYYMRLSCKLGLMGMNADGVTPKTVFDPNEYVNRAQFATVFSRLIFWDKYNVKDETIAMTKEPDYRYKNHLLALKQSNIMNKIDTPLIRELRGYVMLMMMRSDQNKLVMRSDLEATVIEGSAEGAFSEAIEIWQ